MKKFFKDLFFDGKEGFLLALREFGRVFVILLVFGALQDLVISPIGRFLWREALRTVPEEFITFSNIWRILNPFIILAGAVLFIGYSSMLLFLTSLMIVTMELGREGKSAGIVEIFRESFRRLKNGFQWKNFPMLVVAFIFCVFLDLFNQNGKFAGFRLPEYISDVVFRSWLLTIFYMAALALLEVFLIKFVFSLHAFILAGKDFKGAVREAKKLVYKKGFRIYFMIVILEGVTEIVFSHLPNGIVWVCHKFLGIWFSDQSGFPAATDVILKRLMLPVLDGLSEMVKSAILFGFLAVLYARYRKEQEMPPIEVKVTELKKNRSYTWVMATAYGVLLGLGLGLTAVLSAVFTQDHAVAAYFLPDVELAAHRGYCSKAPESTVPAYIAAADTGLVAYGELDVRPSKDGVPIVMHDATLTRTTGYDAAIRDTMSDKIRTLDAGSWFSKEFAGTKVPTLEELIAACDGEIDLLIEIKNTDDCPEFEKTVVDTIHKMHFEDKCIIQSPSYESLVKVKQYDPNLKCGWVMAAALGAFYDLPACDFFSIEHTFINNTVINEAHSRGKQVYAWTVNDEKFVKEMADLGVDGLITDEPEKVNDILHKNMGDLDRFVLGNAINDAIEDMGHLAENFDQIQAE